MSGKQKAESEKLICIEGHDERKDWLVHAIASALRWYASSPDKRKGDSEDAVVLSELLQEIYSR
jgi:hypothetical protein